MRAVGVHKHVDHPAGRKEPKLVQIEGSPCGALCVASAGQIGAIASFATLQTRTRANGARLPRVVVELASLAKILGAPKKVGGEKVMLTKSGKELCVEIGRRRFSIPVQNVSIPDTSNRERKPSYLGELEIAEPIDGDLFLAALRHVTPAISNDITRSSINVLCLTGGSLVATDGHRMHGAQGAPQFSREVVTGAAPLLLAALKHMGGAIVTAQIVARKQCVDRLQFIATCDETTVRIMESVSDVRFPPYKQVVPSHDMAFVVAREAFVDAMTTAAKVGKNVATRGASLHANGALNVEVEGFKELVPLESPAERETFITINPKYIAVAASSGETVRVEHADAKTSLDPVKIVLESGHWAVVMPMRCRQ